MTVFNKLFTLSHPPHLTNIKQTHSTNASQSISMYISRHQAKEEIIIIYINKLFIRNNPRNYKLQFRRELLK
jgi:hypothetical protein